MSNVTATHKVPDQHINLGQSQSDCQHPRGIIIDPTLSTYFWDNATNAASGFLLAWLGIYFFTSYSVMQWYFFDAHHTISWCLLPFGVLAIVALVLIFRWMCRIPSKQFELLCYHYGLLRASCSKPRTVKEKKILRWTLKLLLRLVCILGIQMLLVVYALSWNINSILEKDMSGMIDYSFFGDYFKYLFMFFVGLAALLAALMFVICFGLNVEPPHLDQD